jgi:xylulokinase
MQGRWPNDFSIDELGERADTGSVVGESDGTFGIKAGTPLVPGAPDAILTFWAAGLDEPGRGCDPGGHTGGLVVATVDRELPPGMMKMASPAQGCVMVGGPVSAHGASLEWLSRVTSRPIEELLVLAASSPQGARGVMFLPYLEGERSPRWNRQLTGEFHGIRSDTDVADLARAVLEGAAYGLGHICRMLAAAGIQTDVVTCTGSPSRSRLWCEIKASVLGVPFDVSGFSELSAYGAALAAGAGAGWWPRPSTAAAGSWPRPPMSRVEPAPRGVYEEGLDRFIALGDIAQERITRA